MLRDSIRNNVIARMIYDTYINGANLRIPCSKLSISENTTIAMERWSGPYLPIIKLRRKFLITRKPPTFPENLPRYQPIV